MDKSVSLMYNKHRFYRIRIGMLRPKVQNGLTLLASMDDESFDLLHKAIEGLPPLLHYIDISKEIADRLKGKFEHEPIEGLTEIMLYTSQSFMDKGIDTYEKAVEFVSRTIVNQFKEVTFDQIPLDETKLYDRLVAITLTDSITRWAKVVVQAVKNYSTCKGIDAFTDIRTVFDHENKYIGKVLIHNLSLKYRDLDNATRTFQISMDEFDVDYIIEILVKLRDNVKVVTDDLLSPKIPIYVGYDAPIEGSIE